MIHRSRVLTLVFHVLATLAAFAQDEEDAVLVYGRIRDHVTKEPLSDAFIVVSSELGIQDTVAVDDTAGYGFELPYDDRFTLRYGAPGRVTKLLTIDTRNIPEEEREGGHGMNVDMTLFTPLPGRDYSFMEDPIGAASYNPADSALAWDTLVTARMRAAIERSFLPPDTTAGPAPEVEDAEAKATDLLVIIAVVLFVVVSAGITIGLLFFFKSRRS